MTRKLTFDERITRMTDEGLPALCIALRDALPSIRSKEDREEFMPSDMEMLLGYKRLSTAPHELLTHVRSMLRSPQLNAAGRQANEIIDDEEKRRDSGR